MVVIILQYIYIDIKSLRITLKTNTMLYVDYISIKNKDTQKRNTMYT